MSKHPKEHLLYAEDFDDAIKQLVDLLHGSDGTTEGNTKLYLCRGWNSEGLVASGVLRAMANLQKSTICDDSDKIKHFGRILHVDCSLWKNRTMQRAIAKELNLHHVMHIFDKHDEEDDFRGVDDSSRDEISSIGSSIHESLKNERFLMFFHYGGVEDIDLVESGIPTFGKDKVLWTKSGRFYQVNWRDFKLMPTSANMYINLVLRPRYRGTDSVLRILHEEAVGVIGDTGLDGINPETVLDCFLYSFFLTTQVPTYFTGVNYDWATHAYNYWICDGILGEEKAWDIGNALYGVGAIPPLGNATEKTRYLAYYFDEQNRSRKGWYSVTSNKYLAADISIVPNSASSYFLTFQNDNQVYIRNDLFQQASNLRVLKLYNCSFNFASPPFQCCHNLKFLWLDRCANNGKEQSGGPIFSNLLVFDLRFTDFLLLPQMIELMSNLRELNTKGVSWKTMSHAWKKLQKLHKLRVRVTESSDMVTTDSCSPIDMVNLELLDLSGNTFMVSLPTFSTARSLKMLVIDGCSSLEHLALEGAPLLESFSFDAFGPADKWTHSIHLPQKEVRRKYPVAPFEMAKVTKISLNGCGQLRNIFMRALPNLEELDLSGTAIKTLDLYAMDIPGLKKLFLLGCKQLRCLSWIYLPDHLEVLRVDTQEKKRSMVCCGEQRSFDFHAFIAFTDGRFTSSSIEGLYFRTSSCLSKVYLLISCMSHSQANITRNLNEIGSSQENLVTKSTLLPYYNIALTEYVTCSSLVWSSRQLQTLDVHIEIGKGSYNLESMQDNEHFATFVGLVQLLHVHDNFSITSIPPTDEGGWNGLVWCHVERCPKLHSLFSCQDGKYRFQHFKIFSASHLLVAYCIWRRGIENIQFNSSYLQQLQHIYLYNCPRLVFVLPISFTLPNLETLQIAYSAAAFDMFFH